jgi:hypothetical protein
MRVQEMHHGEYKAVAIRTDCLDQPYLFAFLQK